MKEKLHTASNEVNEELQSLSPLLAGLRKEHLVSQKNDYRRELVRERILNTVGQETKVTATPLRAVGGNPFVQRSRFRLIPVWAAASVVAVIGCWFLFHYNINSNSDSSIVSDISSEEAVGYIQQNVQEFEAEQLFELNADKLQNNALDNFSQEEALDYLENNLDDFDAFSDENDL